MDINSPLEFVVNHHDLKKNISLIHASPISSKYNTVAQKLFGHCARGHCYRVLGLAVGFSTSLITTSLAVVETVASLAYAILATLVHTLTFFNSSSLQNHVLKSWAFCRHSFIMIWTPILLLAQFSRNSIYEIELRESFYKIDCAQAAQSIGSVFDAFAGRNRDKGKGEAPKLSPTKIREIEVSIEGLVSLINQHKAQMQPRDGQNNLVNVASLPIFNQADFVRFLKDYDQIKINPNFNKCFSNFPVGDKGRKFVEAVATAMLTHHQEVNKNKNERIQRELAEAQRLERERNAMELQPKQKQEDELPKQDEKIDPVLQKQIAEKQRMEWEKVKILQQKNQPRQFGNKFGILGDVNVDKPELQPDPAPKKIDILNKGQINAIFKAAGQGDEDAKKKLDNNVNEKKYEPPKNLDNVAKRLEEALGEDKALADTKKELELAHAKAELEKEKVIIAEEDLAQAKANLENDQKKVDLVNELILIKEKRLRIIAQVKNDINALDKALDPIKDQKQEIKDINDFDLPKYKHKSRDAIDVLLVREIFKLENLDGKKTDDENLNDLITILKSYRPLPKNYDKLSEDQLIELIKPFKKYEIEFSLIVSYAVKDIIQTPALINLYRIEDPLDDDKKASVKEAIEDLYNPQQVLQLAQYYELETMISKDENLCPKDLPLEIVKDEKGNILDKLEDRRNVLDKAVEAFKLIEKDDEAKKDLIRWILQVNEPEQKVKEKVGKVKALINQLTQPLQMYPAYTKVIKEAASQN